MGLVLALGAALWLGCGLDDGEQAECRCPRDTSLLLFPHCADVGVGDAERPGPDNPVASRIPDCPSGKALLLWEHDNPRNVLSNIRTILVNVSPTQYMDQFTEDFVFVPDPADIDLHPEVYQAPPDYDPDRDTLWTWEQERSFIFNLLDPTRLQKAVTNRWYSSTTDESYFSEDGLQETYIFPYDVDLVGHTVGDNIGLKGEMEVDLVTPTLENPVWTIKRWEDRRDLASSRRSWGELRAEFFQ